MNCKVFIRCRSMAATLSVGLFFGIFAYLLLCTAAEAAGATIDQPMVIAITSIAHMFSVLALKLTAFIIGYKIAKLGYETLVKGITGEFDFGFSSSKTVSAKLKSASPGTLFVLLGAAIIAWGLFVQKPYTIELHEKSDQHQTQESRPPGPVKANELPGPK